MSKNPLSVPEQKKDLAKMAKAISKAGNEAKKETAKKLKWPKDKKRRG